MKLLVGLSPDRLREQLPAVLAQEILGRELLAENRPELSDRPRVDVGVAPLAIDGEELVRDAVEHHHDLLPRRPCPPALPDEQCALREHHRRR